MPEDYQDIVLAAYKKMRDNGELRTILTGETTTRLKKACLKVYDSRYNPKDADILSMFFEIDRIECDDFRKVIYDSEPDDYKALCNHIKEETGKTSEENTDLLAWLIGFPTQYEWMELSDEEKELIIEKIANGNKTPPVVIGPTNPPILQPKPPREETTYRPRFSQHHIIISCIILLFVGTTFFAIWERDTKMIRMPESGEKFMYWDGDHYEPVKDGEQEPGITIIPLNLQTLKQQRKINLPDTLTSYSIGKVWYKGFVKDHEFFTDSGAYPQDIQRVLKPLTNTILTKYTSNYRYLLTRLVWFICATFFISLCGFAVSKLEKEVKAKDESQQQDKEVGLRLEEEPMVEQTEGSLAI
ncbi:hypothetical protein [Pedobacter alluvionis]|uniref:Uncharacterized protein n=1 Tax=Pedobacter alluvionis TaxID=475253 RepID=A0A497Y206_9SPHI|nr:hypothetical protein [Pedobacter alluvionis]RLJ73711.1 hypothetical protein BCL90_3875 [Pedobacter alluvionis]TFB32669.1 hypothetical protein E3V97_01130 [Pedobacter alluvionis]